MTVGLSLGVCYRGEKELEDTNADAETDVAREMGIREEVFPCAYLEVPVARAITRSRFPHYCLYYHHHYYHAVSCAW
jgi:hypothetical protein